ncbi:MAG: Re/Si-specific NAD(P)(+) transhydrogenase subunit alpha [Rhizobiales bacterium]|nr:Re/Si-specific NAD(P)(+) transhydrogenase subunit alpha [Hyphomicrobiales bacterium]
MPTIAVTREGPDEPRVAVTPETAKKLIGLGCKVRVETDAGRRSGFLDQSYREAGADVVGSAGEALAGADILLKVRRPGDGDRAYLKPGTIVAAIVNPFDDRPDLEALAGLGIRTFAMDLMPRITRAQSMDVLSSQSNLAGYKAVVDAAAAFGQAMPMMMTAAGTVPAARVFVMGAGVAGLQAIATARRLGAVVTATDVRPAAKEQVASLGAKFIAVEDEEFKAAETAGGYAKEMSDAYKAKQAALVAGHIAKQDIVVTTALIPGRPAPRLVSRAMVESMHPGAVVFDLAAERGGNCELTVPGQSIVTDNGVTILGPRNVAAGLPVNASSLYAKNLLSFLSLMVGKDKEGVVVDMADEIIKGTLVTDGGAIVHPALVKKEQAA